MAERYCGSKEIKRFEVGDIVQILLPEEYRATTGEYVSKGCMLYKLGGKEMIVTKVTAKSRYVGFAESTVYYYRLKYTDKNDVVPDCDEQEINYYVWENKHLKLPTKQTFVGFDQKAYDVFMGWSGEK